MRIALVTPGAPGRPQGNTVTADRWAAILRSLGHEVEVSGEYRGQPADLLVALHARRSAGSVRAFRACRREASVVVALTGTDLYPSLQRDERPVLEMADRIVVLQPLGVDQLPGDLRARAVVIVQSATPPGPVGTSSPAAPARDGLPAVLLANLRPVKGPLLAARAARRLPEGSAVSIVHAGAALDPRLGRVLAAESRRDRHYRWVGELGAPDARRLLAGAAAMLLTSRHEGGANVLSEALAAGVPVLATRIAGTVGVLGDGYPGYVEPGDARGLAALLVRAERQPDFLAELTRWCSARQPLVSPERERDAWEALLAELAP